MEQAVRVFGYSGAIVASALVGALWPLFTDARRRLVLFLAFAAGVMLGAAFFHMLPEAFEVGGAWAVGFVPVGFVGLFLLERYVLVHACEEPPECEEHAKGHPAFGMTAFLGLSAHTLFDGVALASAVAEGIGMMAFLAIVAHKVPSSLSLASILKAEGRSRGRVLWLVLAFGLMVPLGALLYYGLEQVAHWPRLTPAALAFSAGTFLYIAVSDLLPHIQRHGRDRKLANIGGLLAGLVMMFALQFALPEHRG
ncbi:MAG TPA: ZIP family metal transporter [Myxococcaceae bacterium]|nr:ZIP family metal transporter [Myxococcaceae bacterium]